MTFGKVLRKLRIERDLTQNSLAKTLGISESTIGMYEREQREPDFETLESIADFFNVDMDYLTGRSDVRVRNSVFPSNILPLPRMDTVPLLGTIACGIPKLAEENIESYMRLPAALFGKGPFFMLRAWGDSMVNAGIEDGDLVLIRQQSTARPGQIVVALTGEEATLKRYYPAPLQHRIRLQPENEHMEPIYVRDCLIQGVALKVIKELA